MTIPVFDVLTIPGSTSMAMITSKADLEEVCDAGSVHREDGDISPVSIGEGHYYMPWGHGNSRPYALMRLVDVDETMRACMDFNAEVTAAAGLSWDRRDNRAIDFAENHDLDSVWMGQCTDLCAFGMSVVELTLDVNVDRTFSVKCIRRLETAYCRLSPLDKHGRQKLYYAQWRNRVTSLDDVEAFMPVITSHRTYDTVRRMIMDGMLKPGVRKVAFVVRIPQVDGRYYTEPSYTSLFASGWYQIKQLVTAAKLSKIKNSASLKYHVQISSAYWENLISSSHVTGEQERNRLIDQTKAQIIDFLSGVENSGKTIFSDVFTSPDGKPVPGVTITKIDDTKEGGDWTLETQEAVNMICFVMRVHSNLVGSVPGKSQSNNSGSDKRELYTISQALRTPWRKLLLAPYRFICRANGWPVNPKCDILQLTTLDEHRDIKQSSLQ